MQQHLLGVLRPEQVTQGGPKSLVEAHERKHDRTALPIERHHLAGTEAQAECNRQDATGGRAGDEVKMACDRHTESLLDRGQHGSSESALDASAIQREYSKRYPIRHTSADQRQARELLADGINENGGVDVRRERPIRIIVEPIPQRPEDLGMACNVIARGAAQPAKKKARQSAPHHGQPRLDRHARPSRNVLPPPATHRHERVTTIRHPLTENLQAVVPTGNACGFRRLVDHAGLTPLLDRNLRRIFRPEPRHHQGQTVSPAAPRDMFPRLFEQDRGQCRMTAVDDVRAGAEDVFGELADEDPDRVPI